MKTGLNPIWAFNSQSSKIVIDLLSLIVLMHYMQVSVMRVCNVKQY